MKLRGRRVRLFMLCQLGPRGASSDAGAQRTTRDKYDASVGCSAAKAPGRLRDDRLFSSDDITILVHGKWGFATTVVSDRPIAVAIGEGKWQQAPACRARRHIQTLTKHKAQSATALDDTKPHRTHMTPPPPSPRCHVAASLLCRSRARARARGGGGVTRGAHAARSAPSSGRTGRRRRRLARARVVR